jgi:hypothetical protein
MSSPAKAGDPPRRCQDIKLVRRRTASEEPSMALADLSGAAKQFCAHHRSYDGDSDRGWRLTAAMIGRTNEAASALSGR